MSNTGSNWIRILGSPVLAVAAVGLLAMVGAAPASASGSANGIVGSPHDFANSAWNFRGEICRVCHVPHDHDRNNALVQEGLLWNHQFSAETYTMYDAALSSSLQGTQSAQPDGISKMCLGCHDGSVALNAFDKQTDPSVGGGGLGSAVPVFMADVDADFQWPGPNVPLDGTNLDLRGNHPLSIEYDEIADVGLNPKTDPMGSSGMTIADVLDGQKVQCSSCHDVHDSPGEAVGGTHLLRVAQNAGQGGDPSGLCLTCHNK